MKSFLSTLLLFSLFTTLFAQKPDIALARVHYNFSHVRDTMQRDQPYHESMLLIIGKNAALFTSYDKITQANKLADYVNNLAKANGGNLQNITYQKGLTRPISGADYYFFAKEHKTVMIEGVINRYMIEEEAPIINWKITKDTATISSINCKKATAYFKGRNWIAWYALDMPFQSGPWKLNGLPGLIIEAFDESKDIQFQFAGLEKINDENSIHPKQMVALGGGIPLDNDFYLGKEIKLPVNAIKATREEVTRLKQAMLNNPEAVINSQLAGTGNVKRISGPSAQNTARNTYNNPIELPDKK